MNKYAWPLKLSILGLVTAAIYASRLGSGAYFHYYGAVEYSMSKSLSNFFFGAIEPLGSISLDKIPGSFWLPAIMVHFFGFSIWAINLPNVFAFAIGSVLLAHTVKTLTNQTWGLVAGLISITTPVLAAVAQSNQPEPIFFFSLSLVIFLSTKALGLGSSNQPSLKYLIFSGLAIAMAFQSYMLEAWSIWPALIVGYLMIQKTWLIKIRDLLIAGSISLVASLAWIISVSLVPSSNRPYIGSTLHNSPWEMVFGYNGLGRFSGGRDLAVYRSIAPSFAGPASVYRLFNNFVAGEISWLIPATLLAIVFLIIHKQLNPFLTMVTVWFFILGVMHSAVAGMHQFYTSILVLPMGVLISSVFFYLFENRLYKQILGMVAASAVTAGIFSFIYRPYFQMVTFLQIAAFLLLVIMLSKWLRQTRLVKLATIPVLILAMLATPAVWALDTIKHPSSFNPVAGPKDLRKGLPKVQLTFPGHPNVHITAPSLKHVTDSPAVVKAILDYSIPKRGGSAYLFAVFNAIDASPWIIDTGEPILPIGGFNGSDNVPTLARFIKMVDNNTVRLVLDATTLDAMARKNIAKLIRPGSSTNQITDWVIQHCHRYEDQGLIWAADRDLYNCSIRH